LKDKKERRTTTNDRIVLTVVCFYARQKVSDSVCLEDKYTNIK